MGEEVERAEALEDLQHALIVRDEALLRAAEATLGLGPPADLTCDPNVPSALSPISHDYMLVGEEYGSLADGGSYDVLECRRCGRVAYSPMPD